MALPSFFEKLNNSIEQDHFIKLSLGDYHGPEKELKQVYVKLVSIKREINLSFTFRYKTRDITKNYAIKEGVQRIADFLNTGQFKIGTLFTVEANFICQQNKKGVWAERKEKPTAKKPEERSHDVQKQRKIGESNKSYLHALRLTDEKGEVYKAAQDKWKQINHYIELLSSSLNTLQSDHVLKVVDMGAGKGYLTFALYDYLTNELKKESKVEGIEYRQDLVELCNGIAKDTGFNSLHFSQGTIDAYVSEDELDILIALHACDTATDDAIFKGIQYNAKLIVVAPCCHKQVRRELERVKKKNELDFMTRHGVFLERHAEMLTDSIRALILEYYGYQTKVMQFISDAHTPKNVMIVAEKKEISSLKKQEILNKLHSTKAYFGINKHYLEKICGL
ncbi:class I SAM-dependent methyltransferase [Sphingobacterium yanglingense]|uniref:Methyltransferase family protein n=1 Tax=Sphingobacterium yanglingense TaxID=1437280 RepID=A0A4R6WMW6_9SPHI|nr:SAM-dependent methyltransferase [Sphingobacterium yanglingense]TDQ77411.1 methyltransferase family protein [Sphingobacterium yanglingense]